VLNSLQAAAQRLFLRLDRLFIGLFGERANPLYHLGALSYWMFWLVVISGLYVYAFYETGVQTTYASVQSLTHEQWFAGGVMRSIHRYASDAMVLTMLLHLARHFVFDRYRSFRAFSWITGVVLLWLVYASGINGYMLPWDRMAQFVTTATAEWLDALPVFRGTLMRNFILPEAVNDRFFSLLQFVHIGIPLAVLAVLWVHTQRVPRARTSPPRTLMWGSVAALALLSVVRPAVSQGPADLRGVPAVLDFDWFYLAAYPLIYEWSPGQVWWLVGGATLLLLLLPWLRPGIAARSATFKLTVHPGNRTVPVRDGEMLLDAGLRSGLAMPFECRHGGCGVCKAALLNGSVDHGLYQPGALSEAERRAGRLLLCCATPLSDLEIELEAGAAAREQALPVYSATVEKLERLAPDIMLLALRLPAGEQIEFQAGQYINIILEDGARRSYSFTTAPRPTDCIELHVRRIPGGRFTTAVFERMQPGERLRIEGPLGAFVLHEPSDRPLIFIAGATGFAPVKSLLEHAFESGIRRPLYLYWGVRQRRDLYMAELPLQWQREHANFRFVPVLSDPAAEDAWTGRTGLVHEAITADFPDLSGYAIYACGSLQMVAAAKPAFTALGLGDEYCYSDAFLPGGAPPGTRRGA